MRALVQRVSRASVAVGGELISEIGSGLLVLLGVHVADTYYEAEWLARKTTGLRIFRDAEGRMNEPLGERELLCVSQFTLYGDARRGNRPSYIEAAPPDAAEPLYERFCELCSAKRGVFGAMMAVELVNDGPVTVLLETPGAGYSRRRDGKRRSVLASQAGAPARPRMADPQTARPPRGVDPGGAR